MQYHDRLAVRERLGLGVDDLVDGGDQRIQHPFIVTRGCDRNAAKRTCRAPSAVDAPPAARAVEMRGWADVPGHRGCSPMSRLTELIRQAKEKDPVLGAELEREYWTRHRLNVSVGW